MKRLFIFLVFLLLCVPGQASLFYFQISKVNRYAHSDHKIKCAQVFSQNGSYAVDSQRVQFSSRSTSIGSLEVKPGQLEHSVAYLVQQILFDWRDYYGYSQSYIDRLFDIDSSIQLERANYYQGLYMGRTLGLRLMDGSTVPHQPTGEVFPYGVLGRELPFEKRLEEEGYRFPERILEEETGQLSYILNIGLIDINRVFQDGALLLLREVARDIDARYNQNNMKENGDTSTLEDLGAIIYINASAVNARLNQRYGFEYVEVIKDGKKQRLRMEDGLYIMKIKASELVSRYFVIGDTISVRSESDPWFKKQMELSRIARSMSHTNLVEELGFDTSKDSQQLFQEAHALRQRLGEQGGVNDSEIHYYLLLKEIEFWSSQNSKNDQSGSWMTLDITTF